MRGRGRMLQTGKGACHPGYIPSFRQLMDARQHKGKLACFNSRNILGGKNGPALSWQKNIAEC